MDRLPVSKGEAAFIIGVPLAWAVLLLFHPGGEPDTIYLNLQDVVDRFLVVHIGMLIFIPLFAAAVYVLMRDVEGTAARVSRYALIPFVIFYGAYETLQGIGVGTLVNELNGRSAVDQATRENLTQDFAELPLSRFRSLRQHRKRRAGHRDDRGRCRPPPTPCCTPFRAHLVRHLRGPDHRPSAALWTYRPSVCRHRSGALLAKPITTSPGTRSHRLGRKAVLSERG